VARNAATTGRSTSRGFVQDDQGVQVYIDAQRAGNVDILRQLTVTSASALKYYTGPEAQARFGNGNMSGAIQVISIGKK
jgi:hypothetical protein